jgi:hypothetical protein
MPFRARPCHVVPAVFGLDKAENGGGRTFVLDHPGQAWSEAAQLVTAYAVFGISVALSGDGNTTLVCGDARRAPVEISTSTGTSAGRPSFSTSF